MNLEPAAESIRAQFPSGESADLERRERRVERFGQIAFTGFMIVVIIGVIGLMIAILDRFVFSGDQPFVGIGLMAFLVFAMLTLAYVFLREDLKERKHRASVRSQPSELEMPVVTARLIEEKEFEPIPAVTEDTTELLPAKVRDR